MKKKVTEQQKVNLLRKLIVEEMRRLNESKLIYYPPLADIEDDPEEFKPIDVSKLLPSSKQWNVKVGETYTWHDSEYDIDPVKVKCIGFESKSDGGRVAFFQPITGPYKNSYIYCDAFIHGHQIK